MYNCGFLLSQGVTGSSVVEEEDRHINADPISALEYFYLAYNSKNNINPSITESAKIAHNIISDTISSIPIFGVNNLKRVWETSNLNNFDENIKNEINNLWIKSINRISIFNESFTTSRGALTDEILDNLKVIII